MTKSGTIVALAVLFLCAQPTALRAQTPDDLFDLTEMHDIRLFVNSRDLQRLRERFDQNTVYPADLQWRSLRVRNVGIRSRGAASRNPVKLGLEIDFSRYNSRQRFLGLRSLVLDNLWQDPAMVREQVVMALFERMGEPAPRESFARLYINNEYQGLYVKRWATTVPSSSHGITGWKRSGCSTHRFGIFSGKSISRSMTCGERASNSTSISSNSSGPRPSTPSWPKGMACSAFRE
jgi:hypothetical protein